MAIHSSLSLWGIFPVYQSTGLCLSKSLLAMHLQLQQSSAFSIAFARLPELACSDIESR